MPPSKRRRRALLTWLPQAVRMLSVLCLMHFGLQAAAQSQRDTLTAKQIDTVLAEGKKLRAAGDFARGIEKFTTAARAAHNLADPDREATALRESSACHVSLFQYREALELAQASRALAKQAKDDTAAGAAAMILCSIYRQLGDTALAEKESEYTIHELAGT